VGDLIRSILQPTPTYSVVIRNGVVSISAYWLVTMADFDVYQQDKDCYDGVTLPSFKPKSILHQT